MNIHENFRLPCDNPFHTIALFKGLRKYNVLTLVPLAFILCMLCLLFVPDTPISALIPSFYKDIATIGFGLLASILLLRAQAWRPFYLPVIAFLPITLLLLVVAQIALDLMAYWQQHLLVIAYLIWALLLIVLGAELRREFELKRIVPLMAGAMLLMGVVACLSGVLWHWTPNMLATGLALVSLVYLSASKRVANGVSIILGLLIVGTTAYAYQATLGVMILNRSFSQLSSHLQYFWLLTKESWHIFLVNPLLGAGWGQFAWQDLQLANIYPHQSGMTKHPHNFLMQLLAETGIAGFAIVLVGLGLWLKRIAQSNALSNSSALNAALFQSSRQSANPDIRWLYACLVLLMLAALLNNALQAAPVLGFVALVLGLLEERIIKLDGRASVQFKDTALLGQLSVLLLLAIGVLVLVTTHRQYTTIENWYKRTARFTQFQEQHLPVMLNTFGTLRHQSLLTPYLDMGIVRALPNHPKLVKDKLAINTQLLQHSPQAIEAYNQAELLAVSGQTKFAKQQLQRAINRHPDYLHGFSMRLIETQSKEVMPLLFLIVRHNKKEIAEEQAEAKVKAQNLTNTHETTKPQSRLHPNKQRSETNIKAVM